MTTSNTSSIVVRIHGIYERDDVLTVIRGRGPVSADWAWWAAEAAGLVTLPKDDDYMEAVPFDTVREKLADLGIEVDGEPET